METLSARTRISDDARLVVEVPMALRGAEVEVVVVLQKAPSATPSESLGWPLGFFDRVCGSITDENFKRWPQGSPDPPPSFG